MGEVGHRVAEILHQKAGQYDLGIFAPADVRWLEGRLFEKRGRPYLECLTSGRNRRAGPEEVVRQHYGALLSRPQPQQSSSY